MDNFNLEETDESVDEFSPKFYELNEGLVKS